MKTTIQAAAAAITLIASSAAHAQDAVQWKVSDGGNGHWYQGKVFGPTMTSAGARGWSHSHGGHLVTITSAGEQLIVQSIAASDPNLWSNYFLGPLIGMQRSTGACWLGCWDTGESVTFTKWHPGNPDPSLEGCVFIYQQGVFNWQDYACDTPGWGSMPVGAIVEWSADCNGDGVVDYGQCRDGSLPDYNGNNIPDCCESGTSCVVGNYPVQWRVEDGGNGHWYQSEGSNGLTFEQARAVARGSGGWVVMPKTLSAVNFVFSRLVNDPALWWSPSGVPRHGPWIGLVQDPKSPEYSEPGGGWRWMDGSVASYFNWADDPCQPQPANCFCGTSTCGLNNAGFYTGGLGAPVTGAGWGAFAADMSGAVGGLIIEWSADCNTDGIVDYGQILQGQLVDTDSNGVPDICEDPCPGDITNGGTVDATDLSIVLAAWGSSGQGEFQADIDGSGLVDGGDLALVLGGWGPCPE